MAYFGPGDIKSGAITWCGFRAYNAAYAAQATDAARPCLDISNSSGANAIMVPIATTGGIDVTQFNAALATNGGSGVALCSKFYDQTGNGLHYVQATAANMPIVTANAGGLGANQPCLTFDGATVGTRNMTAAITFPATMDYSPGSGWSFAGFVWHDSGASGQNIVYGLSSNDGTETNMGFRTDASAGGFGGSAVTQACTDNAWHSVIAVYNTAGVSIGLDGTSTAKNWGAATLHVTTGTRQTYFGSNTTVANKWRGRICEIGVWADTLNSNIPALGALASGNPLDGSVTYYFSAVPGGAATTFRMGSMHM